MKTMLDIPDEVADEVRRQAEKDGRGLADQVVQLVRLGLLASTVARSAGNHGQSVGRNGFSIAADPATGLPIIHSPPDAPIRSMTVEEFLALIQNALAGEDLERAGLTV